VPKAALAWIWSDWSDWELSSSWFTVAGTGEVGEVGEV
jgi:hypothetical protein